MTRGNYSSNSGMFARRGDPWVSRKEGIKDFNRDPDNEDAEYDFDHRFHSVGTGFGKPWTREPKKEHHDPIPEKSEEDFGRRKANILLKMRREMRQHSRGFVSVVSEVKPFRTCAGCRYSRCIQQGRCLGDRK